jgi:hypothetical protein
MTDKYILILEVVAVVKFPFVSFMGIMTRDESGASASGNLKVYMIFSGQKFSATVTYPVK